MLGVANDKLLAYTTLATNAIILIISIALLIVSAVSIPTKMQLYLQADLFAIVLDSTTRTTCLLQHSLDNLCQCMSDIPDHRICKCCVVRPPRWTCIQHFPNGSSGDLYLDWLNHLCLSRACIQVRYCSHRFSLLLPGNCRCVVLLACRQPERTWQSRSGQARQSASAWVCFVKIRRCHIGHRRS